MKLSDLTRFDLKNLDVQTLIEDLRGRQEVFLRVVLVVGAIAGAFFAYSNRQGEALRLEQKVPLLDEKSNVIDTYKKSESEKKEFLESFPKDLEEDELKDFITDLAAKYHLSIKSFSSLENSSDKYYERLSLQINFMARDFIELVLFIHEIETSGYALRVDSWRGQMQEQYQSRAAELKRTTFDSQIKITALKIKK